MQVLVFQAKSRSNLGKSLTQRTYENAKQSKILDHLIVATDDNRMYDHVQLFGGEVVMTSSSCLTEPIDLAKPSIVNAFLADADIVINIQGDEPTLDPAVIQQVVDVLINDPQADVSTAIIPIKTEQETLNPSVTKCVVDAKGYALYFSRGLIPAGRRLSYRPGCTYYKTSRNLWLSKRFSASLRGINSRLPFNLKRIWSMESIRTWIPD